MYVFGIHHSPEKFVQIAKTLWHPYDELRHLPDPLTRAIFNVLSSSKTEVARRRLSTLRQWRQWADELACAEVEIKRNMPSHVRGVMMKKRLVLLEKLATEVLDWPDKNFV